jgi:glycogen debranching enzyme
MLTRLRKSSVPNDPSQEMFRTTCLSGDGMNRTILCLALIAICSVGGKLEAQTAPPALPVLTNVTQQPSPLAISREIVANKPVSVVGPRGALLGEQDGKYEAWIFPWKIFSGMRITANMENYAVPINVNDHASWIDVQPDHTTITYSHANFTLRQTMIAPKDAPDGSGVLVFYQIESVRPMTLTFSFDPVMQRMWPAASDDLPSTEWVPTGDGSSGFYILHENFPDHAVGLAMPRAVPGILPPYQERASSWPLQFLLHFDPAKDATKTFPLLIALANTEQEATKSGMAKRLFSLEESLPSVTQKNASYYSDLLAKHTAIVTPDKSLNAAFSWAEVAIDQLRVQTAPDHNEEAFTAGFVGSGNTARPGFGWFFGRDALWTLYAVNSYGDYEASRKELEFLLHRQRTNGQIMHEWSQTADLVDWKSLPYEYAAADATPLLPMVMNDYLKISGDNVFVRSHWRELEEAWKYETSHDSPDGIYNNGSGTGWVESWIPAMPHQEIYLAVLDEQASIAFSNLARATGHNQLAEQAKQRANTIRRQVEKKYFLPASGFYIFSINPDGSTDDTATVFPSVAWWDGSYSLDHPEKMFSRWASSEFSTDWGLRLLSDQAVIYDPISYHQGTVWPLFTGWASVAEYRAGHPLSAYAHLMQNANLTYAQDLGSVTELLSGKFYQTLGRSTAHQLWSSAMVISPVLRGMFGLEWDTGAHTLTVTPHLPADWNTAEIQRIPFGSTSLDLSFVRQGQELLVKEVGVQTGSIILRSRIGGAKFENETLHIPLPAVEVAVKQELPKFGSETGQMKILNEEYGPHHLTITLSALASAHQALLMRENADGLHIMSTTASIEDTHNDLKSVTVDFPTGAGYVTTSVQISW